MILLHPQIWMIMKVFDKLFRKLVFQLEKNKSRSKKPFVFDDKAIKNFLGPEKFKDSVSTPFDRKILKY